MTAGPFGVEYIFVSSRESGNRSCIYLHGRFPDFAAANRLAAKAKRIFRGRLSLPVQSREAEVSW
jgi:hypothetical protein